MKRVEVTPEAGRRAIAETPEESASPANAEARDAALRAEPRDAAVTREGLFAPVRIRELSVFHVNRPVPKQAYRQGSGAPE